MVTNELDVPTTQPGDNETSDVVEFTDFTSSNIQPPLRYVISVSELHVTFKSGDKWKYTGVSRELFDAMCASPSIGSFFHSRIKNTFPGEKM